MDYWMIDSYFYLLFWQQIIICTKTVNFQNTICMYISLNPFIFIVKETCLFPLVFADSLLTKLSLPHLPSHNSEYLSVLLLLQNCYVAPLSEHRLTSNDLLLTRFISSISKLFSTAHKLMYRYPISYISDNT